MEISLWSPIDREFYKIQFTTKTSETEMKTREKKTEWILFYVLNKAICLAIMKKRKICWRIKANMQFFFAGIFFPPSDLQNRLLFSLCAIWCDIAFVHVHAVQWFVARNHVAQSGEQINSACSDVDKHTGNSILYSHYF